MSFDSVILLLEVHRGKSSYDTRIYVERCYCCIVSKGKTLEINIKQEKLLYIHIIENYEDIKSIYEK